MTALRLPAEPPKPTTAQAAEIEALRRRAEMLADPGSYEGSALEASDNASMVAWTAEQRAKRGEPPVVVVQVVCDCRRCRRAKEA